MDTKEKKREAARQPQRKAAQQPRQKSAAEEARPRRDPNREESARRAAAAPAAAQKAPRQRPAQQGAARKEAPSAGAASRAEARQTAPASGTAQRAESRARAAQQTAAQQRRPRQEAPRRPADKNGQIPVSAPQGTGPRKSAPQRSRQEAAAAAAKRKNAPKPAKEKKNKNGLQSLIAGFRKEQPEKDMTPEEKAEYRRRQRELKAQRKRKQAERNDTPALIYTQPATFNRDRFLIQMLTVLAVVAALVLGMSVFFKVKTITVAGAETYSAWAVREASGIAEGDNLLTFSKARASAQIRAKLSYVDNVRIGIKLPDTVIIYVEELDVAYSIKSSDGDWWLINSGGRVVEQITGAEAENYTQVLGVTLDNPQVGVQGLAAEDAPLETTESGEIIPITVTGAQRFSSALQILKALEANDIVGEAASVEVSSLEEIVLWYGSRYEVLLGDTTRMEYKIACMNDAILQMSGYQSGILDITFTNKLDQVVYTPFG